VLSLTGLISRIFSSRIFVRINKLTYAIYLLNPIIITVVFGEFDLGGNVDPAMYLILIIGISLITYVIAIVFTLLFEIPFYKLSNEILKGSTPTSSSLIAKKIN
jgi:peptidoglycan/LPS O-acetylase OafA/YrhL